MSTATATPEVMRLRRFDMGHTTEPATEKVDPDEWCRRNDVAAQAMIRTGACFLPPLAGDGLDPLRYTAHMPPMRAVAFQESFRDAPHFEVRIRHHKYGRTYVSLMYLFEVASAR